MVNYFSKERYDDGLAKNFFDLLVQFIEPINKSLLGMRTYKSVQTAD